MALLLATILLVQPITFLGLIERLRASNLHLLKIPPVQQVDFGLLI